MKIQRYHKVFLSVCFLTILAVLFPVSAIALQLDIEKIKYNTIQLTSLFPDGGTEYGFGFVVGERAGFLYIATARHVVVKWVDEDNDYVKASSVKATFYHDQGSPIDKVEVLDVRQGELDLTLLRVTKPDQFKLSNTYFTSDIKRKDKVQFIGRDRKWWVPAQEGTVNETRKSDGKIEIEISTIKPGTSGAPLVTKKGIAGLIIKDQQSTATAIHIDVIREFVERYNYPWMKGKLGMFWNETDWNDSEWQ